MASRNGAADGTRSLREIISLLLTAAWRNKFSIIFVTACVAMGLCVYYYDYSLNNSSMSVTFNYTQASQSVYPNGAKMSMYDMISDEVIKSAIKMGGLEGKIGSDELSDCLSITAGRTRAITDEKSYYMATSYNMSYHAPKRELPVDTRSMLQLIGEAYKNIFYEEYSDKHTVLNVSIEKQFEGLEYLEISDLITTKTHEIQSYMYRRGNQDRTFMSGDTGETFNELASRLGDLLDVDVAKFKAYVTQSGLVVNPERYLSKLKYNNRALQRGYNNASDEYLIRLNVMKEYDAALTAAVLIPTWDKNQEFYMSRTKVGVDYLAGKAETAALSVSTIKEKIDANNLVIRKFGSGKASDANSIKKAETMIKNIMTKLNKLAQSAKALDDEYIRYKTKRYLQFGFSSPSFAQLLNLKMVIVICGAFAVLQVIMHAWLMSRKERKG